MRKGRSPITRPPHHRGDEHPLAKLSSVDVAEIRASFTGRFGQKAELARRFGVSQTQIANVLNGKHWPTSH